MKSGTNQRKSSRAGSQKQLQSEALARAATSPPDPTSHHCVQPFFLLTHAHANLVGCLPAHTDTSPAASTSAPPASLCARLPPPTTPRRRLTSLSLLPSARLALACSVPLSLFTYKQALSLTPHSAFPLYKVEEEKNTPKERLTPPTFILAYFSLLLSRSPPTQPTNRATLPEDQR